MASLSEVLDRVMPDFAFLQELSKMLHADDPRDRLCIQAADYTVELGSGIVILVSNGHPGAAAAMARLEIEAALSSLYLLYRASLARAVAMEAGTGRLPDFQEMSRKCSTIEGVGEFLGTIDIGPFNKLTHGDAAQLTRRLIGEPPFDEPTQVTQVLLAEMLALAAMQSAVVAANRHELQKAIHSMRGTLVEIMRETIHLDEPGPPIWMERPQRSD